MCGFFVFFLTGSTFFRTLLIRFPRVDHGWPEQNFLGDDRYGIDLDDTFLFCAHLWAFPSFFVDGWGCKEYFTLLSLFTLGSCIMYHVNVISYSALVNILKPNQCPLLIEQR